MESFKALVLSTGHLTEADRDTLVEAMNDPGEPMIMGRDTGFFVMLYDDQDSNIGAFVTDHNLSTTFMIIIGYAHNKGYRMIQFDADGPEEILFAKFSW